MKLKKLIPVFLATLLLTSCKEVFADALPELKDPEEWGEIYEITLRSDSINNMEDEEQTLNMAMKLNFYEDGASLVNEQTLNGKNSKVEEHLYKTETSAYFITIIDGEREEDAIANYDFMLSMYSTITGVLYVPFELYYSLAEELVDKDAISDIIASEPTIDAIKLTQKGDTFTLDVKGNAEYDRDTLYSTHAVIQLNAKDGIPRFTKAKTTVKDGNKVVAETDEEVIYTYRETLPKYNGPKVK